MSADARELRDLAQDLSKAGQRVHNQAVRVVAKTAADITADAKSFAPVDTGNLKNSIGHDLYNSGGEIGAEVGPTANYGVFQEFGTSRMAPQPFLGPAFDRRIDGFEQAMARLAGEVL